MRYFFILLLTLTCSLSYAQSQQLGNTNLSQIEVDDLSDQQIRQFLEEATSRGLSQTELEQLARARGMSGLQIQKLRSRIAGLESSDRNYEVIQKDGARTYAEGEMVPEEERPDLFEGLLMDEETFEEKQRQKTLRKIYGYDLFNSKNLTFEPSLNIPTPENYQLGAGDELMISVWGASEATYQLSITPDGYITIPSLGLVYLNGLTVDEAQKKLFGQLSRIYSGLRARGNEPPNTYFQVSLSGIRSIRVNVLGEVNFPGTYSLSSLGTAFNALYLAGGPSLNGSYRKIDVIRQNKVISTLDVYDFLISGIAEGNTILRDQDIIKINPYQVRAELKGAVKRPGIYELQEGETFEDLIRFAGGFGDRAYTSLIKVERFNGREKQVLDIANLRESAPMNGDVVTVEEVIDRYSNRVQISGAVFKEGSFELTEGITLTALIDRAEGIREDAFLKRANIFRLREDLTTEVLSVPLGRILRGEAEDPILKREDQVLIPSIFDLQEEFKVTISGEVLEPGTFDFAFDMSLEDLIVQAGGLKQSAENAKIEVARRRLSETAEEAIAEIFTFPVNSDLSLSDDTESFTLQPFDQVYVRKSPGYEEQVQVQVQGEVNYPGSYSLSSRNERLSTIIRRAGGVTDYAYLKGAKVIRRVNQSGFEEFLKQRLSENDTSLQKLDSIGIRTVGIDLEKILENPGSEFDIVLQAGDILEIPRYSQTVQLSGEVLYPSYASYEKTKTFRGYVNSAGGFTRRADKSRSFVVYPNGSAKNTRNFLLWRDYPKVDPGSEIVIPVKPERRSVSAGEILGISSGLASLSLVIIQIINLTQ